MISAELKNVFMLSLSFKEFADALPYFGGSNPYDLEQTNKNIDEELAIIEKTADEN